MTTEEKNLYELLCQRHSCFRRKKPPATLYDTWGIEAGVGWWPLILEFAERAEKLGVTLVIRDIKEKYHSLRIDADVYGAKDFETQNLMDDFAVELEDRSALICENCGKQHSSRKAAQFCHRGIPVSDPNYALPVFEELPFFYHDPEYDDKSYAPKPCTNDEVIALLRAKLTGMLN